MSATTAGAERSQLLDALVQARTLFRVTAAGLTGEQAQRRSTVASCASAA